MANTNILGHLATLTTAELDEVIRHAKALKQFAAVGAHGAHTATISLKRGTDPYDWVLGVCASVCQEQGLSMLDVEALKASRVYKAGFRVPIVAVHQHVATFAKGRLRQRVVYRLAYRHMVARYHWGPTRMVASTAQIPHLLDEMLPGYYQAGLMDMAVKRMTYE
jgi:hypothetical protein